MAYKHSHRYHRYNYIQELYNKLLGFYGFQNWWPVISKSKRQQQLEIVLGAILTQNTSWKNVEKVIKNLYDKGLITVKALLTVDIKKLTTIIKAVGYYNQKALRLKQVALFLKQNPLSNLEKLDGEKLRRLLLSIKGVGFETADAICLYAFNKPCFVVDSYTKRFFLRLNIISKEDSDYESIKQLVESYANRYLRDLTNHEILTFYKEFHALIDEHCKVFCKKKPLCSKCFLSKECSYNLLE